MSAPARTPLYGCHLKAGAKMVPFAGWEMPVSYAGILAEHRAVREDVGLFDVSHMGRFRLTGRRAGEALDYLVTGRAGALDEGRWLYTLLLNRSGNVLDDLLVGLHHGELLLVVNAANRTSDFNHLEEVLNGFGGTRLTDESGKCAMPAVQGPRSREVLEKVLQADLSQLEYYRMDTVSWKGDDLLVSRTGYTGELGYELFVPAVRAAALWEALLAAGAVPCGLGARDTLRLEMGYRLYGHELDQDHTPLEAGLGWAVDLEKEDFIGRQALVEQKKNGVKRILRGVESSRGDLPRPGYRLTHQGSVVGTVASGGPSPSLDIGIGTAYLPAGLAGPGTVLEMEIRKRSVPVTVVRFPFYKKGTARI
ncbi:MAG: glycine cleavage system aminomethyltransferase GcvT [Candidatus Glassbacteria bacterium]|nr:glycine cleavage system aminomethyltransferase GcvT [Candidatus Glassbacteria bacterium]